MYGRTMYGRHALATSHHAQKTRTRQARAKHAALRELVDERIAHVRGDARLAAVLQLEDTLDHLRGSSK